jgi:general secretion pathway protein B
MSYILDALKKSEAENDPAASANLALNQQRAQSRTRLTGILVVAALLINAGVLVWLFAPSWNPSVAQPLPRSQPEPAVEPPAEAIVRDSVATIRPTPEPAAEPIVVPPIQAPAPIPPPTKARLTELPASVRARFPGLAFSTHIYADDPSLRAIVANGERLAEGDEIGNATVAQITEQGVIVEFERYLVEIPVVSEWD